MQPYDYSPFQGHVNSWSLIFLSPHWNSCGSTTFWANFPSPPMHYILISITSFLSIQHVPLKLPAHSTHCPFQCVRPSFQLVHYHTLQHSYSSVDCLDPKNGGSKFLWNVNDFPDQYSVIYQTTWIFLNTTIRTSNITTLILFKILNSVY